ncbi:3-oxoacyl-ACP synthase III family protein [Streptomyces sp. NPDC004126]|uniref:3-oxoacyl-ACP synthase III family protein n=1 Tax=Streptomyces sp. NPDC004126 TaxID=3390695 RepID=UPI003CFE1AE3
MSAWPHGAVGRPEVGILGTGSCLPGKIVPSRELEAGVQVPDGWIEQRIGVRERRFVQEGETGLDLAVGAARRALDAAGVDADEVDAIILATSTADLPIPGIGPRLQGLIGAPNALAFDVNAACAGFLVGCELGRGLLAGTPGMRHVLVVATDTYSRATDPSDRRTHPLFGDGAGAVLLGRVPEGQGICGTGLYTDGRLSHYVTGGPGLPAPAAAPDTHFLKMSGREVADLVRSEFPRLVNEALKEEEMELGDIDHLVCHQANPNLLQECASAMGFAAEQLVLTGDRIGNTGAASIPLGLDIAWRDGRIKPGDTVLMISFGAGMTWGRTTMRWPDLPGAATAEMAA